MISRLACIYYSIIARGYWDLAKGKLEKGETNLQAAVRELKEETGLKADIYPWV